MSEKLIEKLDAKIAKLAKEAKDNGGKQSDWNSVNGFVQCRNMVFDWANEQIKRNNMGNEILIHCYCGNIFISNSHINGRENRKFHVCPNCNYQHELCFMRGIKHYRYEKE